MLFLRITPTLPNLFINLASPIVDVPFHIFFFATLIGLFPASYITVRVSFSAYLTVILHTIFTLPFSRTWHMSVWVLVLYAFIILCCDLILICIWLHALIMLYAPELFLFICLYICNLFSWVSPCLKSKYKEKRDERSLWTYIEWLSS